MWFWVVIVIGIMALIWWRTYDSSRANGSTTATGQKFSSPPTHQANVARPPNRSTSVTKCAVETLASRSVLQQDANRAETDASVLGFELGMAFYHMTHYCNLHGIFEHGILSWTDAHEKGFTQTDISNPDVQRRRNRPDPIYSRLIHDYAPLYFNPKNPMLFVRKNIQHEVVILKVSPDVLLTHQHLFTDGNAASRDTQFSTDPQIVSESEDALGAAYWPDVPDGKRRRCAEVLIYPAIEPMFIVTAICSNRELKNTISDICPVPIVIDPAVYF